MTDALQQIEAIILDMDGTLVDTESLYRRTWQESANTFGFEISREDYNKNIGMSFDDCMQNISKILPPEVKPKDFGDHLLQLQREYRSTYGFPFKKGAEELLSYLMDLTVPVGLVTSSSHKNINNNFGKTPFNNMFDTIVACEDVNKHKPDPEPYLKACKQMKLSPKKIMVIEDSNVGVRAAIKAGCQTYMIPDILPPAEDVVNDLVGVYKNLHEILNQVVKPRVGQMTFSYTQ